LKNGPQLSARKRGLIVAIFLLGAVLETGASERATLRRIAGHGSTAASVDWRAAGLLAGAGLKPGNQIGVISWEPNLHCDWAYIAGLHITGEIATPEDWNQFWSLTPEMQRQVLARFRSTGATAVVVWNKPDQQVSPVWVKIGDIPVWLYRL
jgi:hypothetical protein